MSERTADRPWPQSFRAGAGMVLVAFAASLALAWLCLQIPRAAGTISPIWLPNAALLAALLLLSRHQWRAVVVAAFLGQFVANLVAGSSLAVSAALALCNIAEVLLAAGLLLKTVGPRPDLSKPQTSWRYVLIVGATVIGGGGLAAVYLSALSAAPGPESFLVWVAGDFAGLMTVTPCLIILASNRTAVGKLASARVWPLAVLLLVAAAVFSQDRYPLTYLVVAALLLVTWRLEMVGAAIGALATLLIAVSATVAGHGPFALMQATVVERILALQLFLTVSFYLSVPVAIQRARARAFRRRLLRTVASARSTRAKYRRIADGVSDVIVQTDGERTIYVSPSCRRFGYTPAELIGQPDLALVHPDDIVRLKALRARLTEGKDPIGPSEWRIRIRSKNGEYRWMEGAPNLLRDDRGDVVAIETVFRDVTDNVAAEAALAASEARYRLLAENLTDLAATYGADGVVRFASPSARALLGYEPEELVGRQITELLHPDDVARCGAEFARHRSDGPDRGPFKIEYRMFRKDGSLVWVEAHPRPIFEAETEAFVEWQDSVRDIGERKALEAELRRAQAEAEAAAQAKADFLANMSHELRTPLTSVLGFAKLAEASEGLTGPVRTYVERMSEASRALLALVNDILDFSKLEAGDVTIHPKPVDVGELVRSCLHLFEAQARDKGLTLALEEGMEPGLWLQLDPDRMRQVLLNLIGNAVKFTRSGGVWVAPRYDAQSQVLSVEVRDTGPGISPEGQQRLFQRFSQVDGADARHYGGTGLGLAICKGIIDAMGGQIGVSSEVGVGSVFTFSVAAKLASQQAAGSGVAHKDGRIRLLVADDHADICELVGLLLEDFVDVTAAHDGEAAVRLAEEQPFDVMLLDQRMPRLDGPGALRRIRAGQGPNRDTPALAFSAEGEAKLSRQMVESGFIGLVAKPITPAELTSAIAYAVSADSALA